MTDLTEKLNDRQKETSLDSKEREASELETKEAGLHNKDNRAIHDQTQARHKIEHSATDLLRLSDEYQGAALEMVDEEAGYVLTGKGYKPLVPEDISATYQAILKEIPEVKDPSLLPDRVAEATIEYCRAKGMIPDDPASLQQQYSYNPDDPHNGSDSLPAMTEDEVVDHGFRIKGGIENWHRIEEPPLPNFMAALSPEMRAGIIAAFQKSGQVGELTIDDTTSDILRKTIDGYIDTLKFPLDLVVAAGKGLWEILVFERDLMVNPEQAQQTAAIAGDCIGKALVSGIKLWTAGGEYAADLQQSGDLKRPFQDLGNTINKWYDSLTPGDQMQTMATISAGFGIGAAAGQLRQLVKPGAFVQFLEETAQSVPKDPEAQAKAAEAVRKLIEAISKGDELITPEGVRVREGRMTRPKSDKPDTGTLMSREDDVGGLGGKHPERDMKGDQVPEKCTPSGQFLAELAGILERLSPGEKEFLAKHKIQIKPIRRVADKFPAKAGLAACYDASENTIYVGAEVDRLGKFVSNYDLEFAVRHEFGHAYNAKIHPFGEYISNRRTFRAAFRLDAERIPPEVLDELRLSQRFKNLEEARDEVFADAYVHAIGLQSHNPYSQKLKHWFPNCLRYLKEMPKP